ncbi:MAG: cellulose biosynthesis cyclic di-GMP-binding regulatory protein BcsB [Candidatus Melainabacteria bacterium]|nr:cellulose biosynthesis cyclic di-GMP-binding regulatory protein BcsB [Candidatus Melainabacteria bacterium]
MRLTPILRIADRWKTNRLPQSWSRSVVGLALLVVGLLSWASTAPLWADSHTIQLKDLKVEDSIYLPTVRAQRELIFTKPATWQVSGATVEATFQHSLELLPAKSWLQVIVNDKVLKHVALGPNNAEGTTLQVAVPPALLKDFNRLVFRVEQHYTDKCEDPLDPSLWTQILPQSKVTFNYNRVLPTLNLAQFPYPLVDVLSYAPSRVRYFIGKDASPQELLSMAYLNTHMAQMADDKPFQTSFGYLGSSQWGSGKEHLVFVGTGTALRKDLAAIGLSGGAGGYNLQGDRWTRAGQNIEDSSGVVILTRHPKQSNLAVLIVSGNSAEAVQSAAQYITNQPKDDALTGTAVETGPRWRPVGIRSNSQPKFIEAENRTLTQLGYGTIGVEKINAPPITYDIPLVTDLSDPATDLEMDVVYSYSPDLNPLFSSLELRLNDRAIANIPLLNKAEGEKRAKATVLIPKDLLTTHNKLVAQFHMLPEKYGWCVDNYDDKSWGKIHDDSLFRIKGGVQSRLPDLNLMSQGRGYPLVRSVNLENLHVVVPEGAKEPGLVRLLLGVTSRLGRLTDADTDLRFTLGQTVTDVPGGKDIVILTKNALPDPWKANFSLRWPEAAGLPGLKLFHRAGGQEPLFRDPAAQTGPVLEQVWQGDRQHVTTLLASTTDAGLLTLSRFFEDDTLFESLEKGPLKQMSLKGLPINTANEPVFYQEKATAGSGSGTGNGWFSWMPNISWTTLLIGGLVLLGLLIILPLVIRGVVRMLRK